ncbi:MAG: hypothetical protein NVS2B11_16630 [Acetobacteraceae bacterium]
MRDEWLEAPDLPRKQKIASDIQEQAFQDLPYWPLGHFYNYSAYRADLTGILHGIPSFWHLQRA